MSCYKKLSIAVCIGLLIIGANLTVQYISFRNSMDEKMAKQRQWQKTVNDLKKNEEELRGKD